ncbi:large conductance mechanosensitive channel [Jatrophihabitans endophyticus]|uniref:Large-conductance mechanosensitive channel n=1 Tax=Jatrophihabitans endophyticus TaxID=1206085 RepID=A0A1M5U0W9_9ACTN|nr:large conductance mechanosensitive channel protein MscL [Jatrophihabitans endophyticus]SHH56516.1 large conductance mechanosensitive channel [Jatrophihabitans endophyticus]
MIKGFKDFIMRGNVVELAIAVVIGTAFQAVVSGVVNAVIKPLVNSAGGANVNGLGFSLRHTEGVKAGSAQDVLGKSTFIDLSSIVNAVIAFLVTAAVVYFFIVVPMNTFQERRALKAAKGEPDPTPRAEDVILLEQIRDLLAANSATGVAQTNPAKSPPTG